MTNPREELPWRIRNTAVWRICLEKKIIKRVTSDLRHFHGVADSAIGEYSEHDVSDYSYRETSSEGTGAKTGTGVSLYESIKDGIPYSIPKSVSPFLQG